MLLNPIVAMLFNQKTNKWHPILFEERPLPGPITKDTPVRHKSFGHHTIGFETREAALHNIETDESIKNQCPTIKKCLDEDIPWDGNEMPAMVCFFNEEGNKILICKSSRPA